MDCEDCKNRDYRCHVCDEFSEYSEVEKMDCRNCLNRVKMYCLALKVELKYFDNEDYFYFMRLNSKLLGGTETIKLVNGRTVIHEKRKFFTKCIDVERCKLYERRT
ncbi:hypothetical protein [Candidatus Lokiarchaeum ossiferum]|uniref:hypothetical protein n=1 Tax=Candidatus Lokiarchaeum ossiferum TaxID=2951803 RepID=UPI00352C301A